MLSCVSVGCEDFSSAFDIVEGSESGGVEDLESAGADYRRGGGEDLECVAEDLESVAVDCDAFWLFEKK